MKQMLALCFLSFAAVVPAFGQIPRTLSYQGVLTDSAGAPKPDGEYSFTFRLYESIRSLPSPVSRGRDSFK
jgi:hypothetical protein